MFKWLKKKKKKSMTMMTVLSLFILGACTVGPGGVEAKSWKHELKQAEDLKYSEEVTNGLYKQLRKKAEGPLPFSDALVKIQSLSKVEAMDLYLDRNNKKVRPSEIRAIVDGVFGIDLEAVSELGVGKQTSTYSDDVLQRVREALEEQVSDEAIIDMAKVEVMDLYWETYNGRMTGEEMRTMINAIFGINLSGISGLEGTGVALFSKNQWISRYEHDLFVVHTGADDVDVWIYPTDYYKNQTGMEEIPQELETSLTALGFGYSEEKDALYYANPKGESVPDNFKGKTMGTVIGFIKMNDEDFR
ncbi:hypothetical protein VKA52_10910 [Halobacillus sp. HZG1]|uniref:hypothetical protein n=1 Tax=Halobacillus sp. HZG1 TaxID=3111769 RepID=UPI002DB98B93|nr:hypothetical protein [Halobacillus sp. HZG1]MEC3884237.1 hypothetical protein [Halobacillus sp. HZG1]